MKLKYYLYIVILSSLFNKVTSGQSNKGDNSTVKTYFKDRLANAHLENQLIPSKENKLIGHHEVDNYRRKLWQIWKETLLEVDSLPNSILANDGDKNLPIHSWKLIDEDPMPFYYLKKGDENSQRRSLFINLHGSGPKQIEFPNTLSWTLKFKDVPSTYFIPQIPNERRYRWWYKPEQFAWERLFRLVMIDDMIDPNKIYFMGISEGGYGSQRLAAFYADYLAGAGPMAGGEPLKNAPPLNFRNIAFSLQTGENDLGFGRNKLTLAAKEEFAKLAKDNKDEFIHNIILQPNKGHGIDYTTTTPWLIQYNRNPHPKHVSWVHFPMHGRYRKGFYNVAFNIPLAINEEENFDRAIFDFKYDQNTIYVSAELLDNEMINRKAIDKLNISLFLNDKYINVNKKVSILLNGKLVFNKKLKASVSNIVESIGIYGDSQRIYTYKVVISN